MNAQEFDGPGCSACGVFVPKLTICLRKARKYVLMSPNYSWYIDGNHNSDKKGNFKKLWSDDNSFSGSGSPFQNISR